LFTGIVQAIGRIARLEARGDGIDLELEVPGPFTEGIRIGDSISVDGCCLTVAALRDRRLLFQAVPETLSRTSLGARAVGDGTNLERALRADGRLDGHIVQGHVDGVGRVERVERRGDDVRIRIACAPELARLLVQKGSVAVDGVSLTVVDPDPGGFSVALIPHTLQETTLGRRAAGERVNLELDVLGKYVAAYLDRQGRESD
jgi:riboflavin synthase alpha subunit